MAVISRKKKQFPVSDRLTEYLQRFGRATSLASVYSELRHFTDAYPYEDPQGRLTLWHTVVYTQFELEELRPKLVKIYTRLKIANDDELPPEHLKVDRIDFGDFGNSKPFRVRVTNQFNDNSDYFYVKVADASRVYGLELEHILSPNRINFLVTGDTLIEEHIAGVPGDRFIKEYLATGDLNEVRVAKEFVKFNERCFIRLLGDMRSVNYVVEITPDFEEVQYRVRAIDFDQQSYEGRRNIYLAQYFADNLAVVNLVLSRLNETTIRQYQSEERTIMARRRDVAQVRMDALLDCMCQEKLSLPAKLAQLKLELEDYYHTSAFARCQSMGEVLQTHLDIMLGT